jgi:hypothetical protein
LDAEASSLKSLFGKLITPEGRIGGLPSMVEKVKEALRERPFNDLKWEDGKPE